LGKAPGKKKSNGPYTGIEGHSRTKTKLSTPLGAYPSLHMIDWSRDLLPEHLWVDLLAEQFGPSECVVQFNRLLDALQKLVEENIVVTGLISSFAAIPESTRVPFLDQNYDLVRDVFYRPAGCLLKSYPSFPATWLCDDRFARDVPPLSQHEMLRGSHGERCSTSVRQRPLRRALARSSVQSVGEIEPNALSE
jgi:hypothetical protein